jgi:hypothetical protein
MVAKRCDENEEVARGRGEDGARAESQQPSRTPLAYGNLTCARTFRYGTSTRHICREAVSRTLQAEGARSHRK